MYAFMFYKAATLTERLITHITIISTFTILYALMFYKIALVTDFHFTHITSTRLLTTTYITGRPAFKTGPMKFFIQTALVKTQSLNIRMYYDRKNIFIAMYTLTNYPLHWNNCVIYKSVFKE